MKTHPHTVVVVAHPDDEVLWFASVLPRANKVIMAFGPLRDEPHLGEARDKSVKMLPLPSLFLRLEEAGSLAKSDWNAPIETASGVELVKATPAIRDAYDANYTALRTRLKGLLLPDHVVFRHNPWGEYGHEDHILVFRAVDYLRREIGFQHWVPAYVSERTGQLARNSQKRLGKRSPPAPIDRSLTNSIMAAYKMHGCWTWDPDWIWPREEWFYQITDHHERMLRPEHVRLINVALPQGSTG